LVIDDESDVLRYLGALLRDEGYEVVTASDGKEGLRLARSCRPDAITLDITMPGMTGLQVFAQIRSDPSLRDTPVIVVSGVMEGRRILAEGPGAPPAAYVDKPVDPEKLLSVLREALRRAAGGEGREA
jgi:CheY-like chemotaxis protein